MADPSFVPGEALIWENRENPNAPLVRKPVAFRKMQNDMMAVVQFGLRSDGSGEPNLLSVPRYELTRPTTPQHVKPPAPPEPERIPLETRRHTLSLRYQSHRDSQDVVAGAETLVSLAQEKVNKLHAELRNYQDLEAHAVDAAVHSLTHVNGGDLSDNESEWVQRDRIKRECSIAESALERLTTELSTARSVANERNQLLHKAAAFVLAAIIERECDRLVKLDEEAFQLRARLRSAASLWLDGAALPIDQKASTILTNFPFDQQDPISVREERNQQRQHQFMEIFTRLVVGDVTADL